MAAKRTAVGGRVKASKKKAARKNKTTGGQKAVGRQKKEKVAKGKVAKKELAAKRGGKKKKPKTVAKRPSGRGVGTATRSLKKTGRKVKKSVRKTADGRISRSVDGVARWRASLERGDGCGAVLIVGERVGDNWDEVGGACAVKLDGGAGEAKTKAAESGRGVACRAGGGVRVSAKTERALAAVGHMQRIKMINKLLEGPATYKALQKVTKLKAGPLYHHVNQLRLAGLILPKRRDLYELTRGGRNLTLAVMAIERVVGDTRRRPLPVG